MQYKQHPLSRAFPTMGGEDYESLCDSITNIGVQNPITLFEGMVLDGWHRYKASIKVGMPCPTVELGDVDPKDFLLALNTARRHVSAQLKQAKPKQLSDSDEPPEYTELDAANDQISDLQRDLVVALMGNVPDDQKNQAANKIDELHAELKSLSAQIKGLTIARDAYMAENSSMKVHIAAQKREIAKLKKPT